MLNFVSNHLARDPALFNAKMTQIVQKQIVFVSYGRGENLDFGIFA